MREAIRALAAILVAAATLAGAAPRTAAAADAARPVALLAPMNFAEQVPAPVVDGFEPVEAVLSAYLVHEGFELNKLSGAKFNRIWRANETGSVPAYGEPGYEQALRSVVVYLAERIDFDVLVVPSLAVRKEQANGSGVRWDGVFQSIDITRSSFDRGGNNIEAPSVRGLVDVASLRIELWSPKGEHLYDGRGGLEILQRWSVDWTNVGTRHVPAEFVLRDDLFEDDRRLARGVKAAFHPYLER